MLKKINTLIAIVFILSMIGCGPSIAQINSLEDLSNEKVGIYTGSEYDKILIENVNTAIPTYFNSYNDEILALKSGKISAFLTDEPLAQEILKNTSGLKILDERLTEDSYAFAISPNAEYLKEEIDNVLLTMKNDGTLEKISDKWFGDNEDNKKLESYDYSPSKTIKFATVSGSAPFAYMKNNQIVGYDIDVIKYIGYKLGYKIEVVEMSFDGIIPALISGKVDMAGCSIIVTEERKKSVLFSLPNYTGGIVIVTNQ